MDYILIAFRSRTETLEFLRILKRYNINCSAVNTPKEAGVGCGLSAKINEEDLVKAKNLLGRARLQNFAGIFGVFTKYGKTQVRSI